LPPTPYVLSSLLAAEPAKFLPQYYNNTKEKLCNIIDKKRMNKQQPGVPGLGSSNCPDEVGCLRSSSFAVLLSEIESE
jgi:hypothetical protein